MADTGFRSFRRDAPVRDAEPPRDNDPLAELARLIGQSGPQAVHGYNTAQAAEAYDGTVPATGLDWAAGDDGYADESQYRDDGHDQPRAAVAPGFHPSEHEPWPSETDHHDPHYQDEPPSRPYATPPAGLSEGPRIPRGGFDPAPPRQEPPDNRSQHAASAQHGQDRSQDHSHNDYAHEETGSRRRSGTVMIVAVLGLALLGTASALAYRTMFGGSVISGLPPIIKPAAGPIKVQPNQQAQAGTPAPGAAAKQGEQLVPHQEQPVNVQSANPVPRVVTTIPVVSNAQAAALPPQPPAASQPPSPPPAAAAPAKPPPPAAPAPPAAAAAPAQSGAKQVHTVTIRPGQPAATHPAPAAHPPAAARPVRAHEPARPPRQTAAAGPLSIVPGPESERREAAPPARTRTALAHARAPRPTETGPAVGGAYAVQVSSQRSEAEAQAAFRALQAKYPRELGGRHAVVRRADLGSKGVYYRALIGPFASGEQAVELCSKLKAAGGGCIIQRN